LHWLGRSRIIAAMIWKAVCCAVALLALAPAAASAACAARDPADLADEAQVLFVGRALDGERAAPGGPLISPARFEVLAYEKGTGASERLVTTGHSRNVGIAEGIGPKPGELWRIYGREGSNGVVSTGACEGSALDHPPADGADADAGQSPAAPRAQHAARRDRAGPDAAAPHPATRAADRRRHPARLAARVSARARDDDRG
jgi:hypothetical protein